VILRGVRAFTALNGLTACIVWTDDRFDGGRLEVLLRIPKGCSSTAPIRSPEPTIYPRQPFGIW